VAPWQKTESGKHMSPEQFKALMLRTPGWQQEKWMSKDKDEVVSADRAGYAILRVQAIGQHEGVDAVQYGYLVAGPQGEQTILTFIMTPTQAPKLEGRDLIMVRSFVYPAIEAPNITPRADGAPPAKE
jgi:hypothetical protein